MNNKQSFCTLLGVGFLVMHAFCAFVSACVMIIFMCVVVKLCVCVCVCVCVCGVRVLEHTFAFRPGTVCMKDERKESSGKSLWD